MRREASDLLTGRKGTDRKKGDGGLFGEKLNSRSDPTTSRNDPRPLCFPVAAIRRYVGCFTVELDPVEFRSTYPEVIDAIRSFTTAAPGEAAHALEPAVGRMSSGKPPPRARWRLAVDGWEGVGSRSSERDQNGRNSRAQNIRAG